MNPPPTATASLSAPPGEESSLDLRELLSALEAVRDGDFDCLNLRIG